MVVTLCKFTIEPDDLGDSGEFHLTRDDALPVLGAHRQSGTLQSVTVDVGGIQVTIHKDSHPGELATIVDAFLERARKDRP